MIMPQQSDTSGLFSPLDGSRLSAMNVGSASLKEPELVFESPAMKGVVAMVERIAPNTASVLITGETGVGKEVVADLIHEKSRRRKPFVKINCAALPRELIESELFGSLKGSFTGALNDRDGLFREAGDGMILLDEISEMPVETQAKLLRVLQDFKVRPVGGLTFFPISCRVIASTNRPPEQAIREGKLRRDLFYRIGAVRIHIPPLRERREDIVPLAKAFLKESAEESGRSAMSFTKKAESFLFALDWPGNVRELQSAVRLSVLMTDNGSLDVGDFLPQFGNKSLESLVVRSDLSAMEEGEVNLILSALNECKGNKFNAAKKLGIGRQTLYNKIKGYGLDGFKPPARN